MSLRPDKSLPWLFASGMLAAACVPGLIGPASQAPFQWQEGQTLPVTYAVDGKPVWERVYTQHRLPVTGFAIKQASGSDASGSDGASWVLVPTKVTVFDQEQAKTASPEADTVSVADVDAFFAEWVAQEKALGREARSVAALQACLKEEGCDIGQLVTEARRSGLSLGDFLAFIRETTGTIQLGALDRLLAERGLNVGDLIRSIKENGATPADFVAKLQAKQQSLEAFFEQGDRKAAAMRTQGLAATAAPPAGTLNNVETVTADVVRDNKPISWRLSLDRYGSVPRLHKYGGRLRYGKERSVWVGLEQLPLAKYMWRLACGDYEYEANLAGPMMSAKVINPVLFDFSQAESYAGWRTQGVVKATTATVMQELRRHDVLVATKEIAWGTFTLRLASYLSDYSGWVFSATDSVTAGEDVISDTGPQWDYQWLSSTPLKELIRQ